MHLKRSNVIILRANALYFFLEDLIYSFLIVPGCRFGFSLDSEDRLSGACFLVHKSNEKLKMFNRLLGKPIAF